MSNASSSGQDDRFSLVASFYGPGNVTSWLCTVASVFVTWSLNVEYRRKDSISTDLIFALAIPGVAAGHVTYMMFIPGPGEHETIQQLFTSLEPGIVQRAAAAEAALNVCETFAAAAVALIFVSMIHGHLKRTLAVLAVGLLAFSAEAMVFVQTRGSGVSVSNLSRPFLFNFFEVMVSILAFLTAWVSIFAMLIIWLRSRKIDPPESQVRLEPAESTMASNSHAVGEEAAEAARAKYRQERLERDAKSMKALTIASFFFIPTAYVFSFFGAYGVFGATDFMSSLSWTARLPFFVPRSATGITELDQMVSVCTGIVALLFSLWHAFKSQREENKRLREESRTRQRQNLARMTCLLRQVQEQLDQAQDESERQVLLYRRDVLTAAISTMDQG